VFFDLAVEDNLQIKFVVPRANTDPAALAEVLGDSRTMIGLSDAGAHLDMLCESGYPTYLLGHWVREKRALTLERAVQRITVGTRRLLRLQGPRQAAHRRGSRHRAFRRSEGRFAAAAHAGEGSAGGRHAPVLQGRGNFRGVIVNGQVLYRDGRHTGVWPGKVLRSS
jgi:N-acyl-D-aspartate/D-glutamate deacylase